MITYRLQTQPQSQPPVKFYRTIALSFLAVTIILLGVVVYITSKKAEIVIVTKEDDKKINLAVDVEPQALSNLSIPGSVTSTGFQFSSSYSPTGNKTIDGVATGEVTIYNKGTENQTLIKTTRLLTDQGVLFRLTDKVTVPANGQIKAQVYSDQAGASSNIGPSKFTVPGLNADKQKIIYAESSAAMAGGVKQIGILKQEDIDAALADYKEKVKQAYIDSLPSSTQKEKTIITVGDVQAQADKKVGEEVSEFKISGTSNILVITYDEEKLADLINREIGNKIDKTLEKVLSVNDEPQVSVSSYDLTKDTVQLNVNQDVMVTIDANSDKLSPQNFSSKKKSEVEAYLMGLDHVSAASVQLTPGWSSSIPSSPDKIKVVVKNVQ